MKYFIFFISVSFSLVSYSQVGVGTTNPTATMDIAGNLRIRSIPEETNVSLVKDSVLVTNGGYVKSIPSAEIVKQALPTTVKGNFSAASVVGVSLLGGAIKIPFDSEDFDTNDEFDPSTSIFTAKQDGIYLANVQIEASATIGVASNFGVKIMKNSTVIARKSFANVGIAGINVTPPIRGSQTLLELNTGDTIWFQLEGDIALGTVNLLAASQDSFFTIHQIR